MKKLNNNKKGFTLIELLAVIVILAILVMIAIPAVTTYLDTARKGTFADAAATAVSAVRMDYISSNTTTQKKYTKTEVNNLLEKKLNTSPFGNPYTAANVTITPSTSGDGATYNICLSDGTYVINTDESGIDKSKVYKINEKVIINGTETTVADCPSGE